MRKSGCGFGLGEFPKSLGFPFNISARAEASDFKFGTQLGFAKAHHKITLRGKKIRDRSNLMPNKHVQCAGSKMFTPDENGWCTIGTRHSKYGHLYSMAHLG